MNNRGVPRWPWIAKNGQPTQWFHKAQADLAASPIVYDTSGNLQQNARHITGTATIGADGTATVSLASPGGFTSATSYVVSPTSLGGHVVTPANVDGGNFTLKGTAGDTVNFIALGT